ncbi:MAG: SOS response-associated peptidase [Thermomicrobiales bacterium]|nr:SOS response-associated peptidase [Thermomicrobiales bacterium]
MCGRYVFGAPEDISERFQLRQLNLHLPHTWNAAPTNHLPVIIENQEGEREAQLMQWGLIPRWAKPGDKRPMAPINARAETITEKPMFRNLIKRHRCLVPANGFYEWKNLGDRKQPYYVTVPDDPLFAFAGLYESFTNDDGEETNTYTIITTEPNELMSTIHTRMPVILHPQDEEEWLDPDVTDPLQVERLLVPYPAGEMEAYPVSRKVGNTRNNAPDLIEPIEE